MFKSYPLNLAISATVVFLWKSRVRCILTGKQLVHSSLCEVKYSFCVMVDVMHYCVQQSAIVRNITMPYSHISLSAPDEFNT